MEAGEEKGGWETGFYFLIFTDIVKMGWDTKPARNEGKKFSFTRHCKYIAVLVVVLYTMMIYPHSNENPNPLVEITRDGDSRARRAHAPQLKPPQRELQSAG